MSVFSVTEIPPLMYVCGDRVKGLAEQLFDSNEKEMKKKYIADCDKNDSRGINQGITHGLCRLLHSQSVKEGLIHLANRFPELDIDLSDEVFEKDIIVKIAGYSDKMLRIIDQSSHNHS